MWTRGTNSRVLIGTQGTDEMDRLRPSTTPPCRAGGDTVSPNQCRWETQQQWEGCYDAPLFPPPSPGLLWEGQGSTPESHGCPATRKRDCLQSNLSPSRSGPQFAAFGFGCGSPVAVIAGTPRLSAHLRKLLPSRPASPL